MDELKKMTISISTLGAFDIYLKDESVLHYFGNSKKTLHLFKYLVGHIGEKTSTNKIMDSVFSQYKYQDPSNTLRGHIHRLRGVLNKINEEAGDRVLNIEYLADNYIFTINSHCKVDYIEFVEEMKKKPAIDKVGQKKAEQIKLLYKGEFMPDDEDQEWTLPVRLDLAKQFSKYMFQYLSLLFEAEKYEEIVEEVDSILEKVIFEEDIQLLYIQALVKLGKSKQITDHYDYLVQRYEAEDSMELPDKIKNVVKGQGEKREALTSLDLFELEKIVRRVENESKEGAFICDKEFFFELFRLMIRQKARDDRFVYVGLVNIATSDFRDMEPKEIREIQIIIKSLIANTIRAQDALSLISDTQVAFMLFDALEGTVERIRDRIVKELEELEKTHNLVVTINYKSIVHEKEYSREKTL